MLSGLTVDEVKAGRSHGRRRSARRSSRPARRAVASIRRSVEVMLAEPADEAFTRDGWLFELKLDGYRLLASKSHGEALLLTRNGNDYTAVFPEIARAVKALPFDECIIDGEVVVLDAQGKPSFSRLQQRGRSDVAARRQARRRRAAGDVLRVRSARVRGLRSAAAAARRAQGAAHGRRCPKLGAVRALDHIEREGEAFLDAGHRARSRGHHRQEGRRAVSRRPHRQLAQDQGRDAPATSSSSDSRSRREVAATSARCSSPTWSSGTLVYAGRVGTGFNDALLAELNALLDPIVRADPPCAAAASAASAATADSRDEDDDVGRAACTSCEVRFREWTPDGLLRHAAFLRMRPDKAPRDCERQGVR